LPLISPESHYLETAATCQDVEHRYGVAVFSGSHQGQGRQVLAADQQSAEVDQRKAVAQRVVGGRKLDALEQDHPGVNFTTIL